MYSAFLVSTTVKSTRSPTWRSFKSEFCLTRNSIVMAGINPLISACLISIQPSLRLMIVMTPVPKYGLPKTGDGITNGVAVADGGVGVDGASLTRGGG